MYIVGTRANMFWHNVPLLPYIIRLYLHDLRLDWRAALNLHPYFVTFFPPAGLQLLIYIVARCG